MGIQNKTWVYKKKHGYTKQQMGIKTKKATVGPPGGVGARNLRSALALGERGAQVPKAQE